MSARAPGLRGAGLAAWALLALGAASCQLVVDGVARAPSNRCESDAQCPSGVCDRERGVCVAEGARTEVVFAAVPPGGRATETATATTLDARSIGSAEGAVDLQLAAPRSVLGMVLAPPWVGAGSPSGTGNADAGVSADASMSGGPAPQPEPIAATVRFVRRGSTPAEGAVEAESGTAPALLTDGRRFSFSRSLVPGVYDVTVTPTDLTRYPPYALAGLRVDPPDERNGPMVLEVVYSSFVEVAGTVVDADTGLPVPGLSVRVTDPTRDNALASTVATTDGYGAYRVLLAPGASSLPWVLQIAAVSQRVEGLEGGGPDWRLCYELGRDALGATVSYANLSPVRLPRAMGFAQGDNGACASCVELEALVEGQTPDGAVLPVAGASVSLYADDALGAQPRGQRGWFQARALSERDGTVRARVMPGTYRVVLTPPDASRFAVTELTLPARGAGPYRGRVLSFAPLAPVTGAVRDGARGVLMPGATVEALPLRYAATALETLSAEALRVARPARAVTDATGRYALQLDPGVYRLVVRPAAGSGYASQLDDAVLVVPSSGTSGAAPSPLVQRDLLLEPPLAVGGSVRAADGAALPEAQVRAFARVALEGGGVLDVELGGATADARGRYSMLLPSRLVR